MDLVLQGGEEERSGEVEEERYGVEWGRGMVKLMTIKWPHLQNSNHMWFQYYGL